VPVSLVGSLAVMQAFGITLNMISLFALVMAIGIVVDNAIVVIEAVNVKMRDEHLPPLEATQAAMKEISGAIIAITLVMAAVFIPVAFMGGPEGMFIGSSPSPWHRVSSFPDSWLDTYTGSLCPDTYQGAGETCRKSRGCTRCLISLMSDSTRVSVNTIIFWKSLFPRNDLHAILLALCAIAFFVNNTYSFGFHS
jgi:HAE1 family hydrophobic/amphiphilic exporter-1